MSGNITVVPGESYQWLIRYKANGYITLTCGHYISHSDVYERLGDKFDIIRPIPETRKRA